MSNPLTTPEELHDDLEEDGVHDSDHYGIAPGITGILIGAALIVFMFALADGFS
ncbi:hypothetical protein RJ527_15695 [Thalassospiraceae bacterium LMO-SO8]|nr:hypothetical protein [Alphaproteobacteria bacterium LMO-S08]WND75466.1 hypothetical protein RJ527_15695 [Thalassospiraceae bacterium LMO-SO8]